MQNIELKSRYADLASARATARALGGSFLWKDTQTDTYFFTAQGKLKLRESGQNGAELIPYLKTDRGGLKCSDYARLPVADPASVKQLFGELLGTRLEVRKTREVYLLDNVRVHLDEVLHLGNFLEFEAVCEDDSPETLLREQTKVRQLMARFEIQDDDLLQGSYPELLSTKN